ncbi:TetR/AcrR family transcriptional regulator [Rubrobacter radiotolerans]|uniref:TetR/AcrR family transcriptional regulator n=1 Tax=Rubrobacter radiotolerans TaxID=42256 RepID=A0AB35T6K0_RUBRA|nr:TetR/AcrR family transcriptional regulator [Rubrobacter radiotolerans]MDX5895319.1 TetR/AcrR family transcriptional regulator [Rubrobacter radiotolerans]
MARTMDARARRCELTQALFKIAAERGLEEVSFREVASEAGVAIATVQYHFGTKDGMLLFAFERITEAIRARIGTAQTGRTVGRVMRRALMELLPLDDERVAEARVYLAFAARSTISPELARVHSGALAELRSNCARVVRTAQKVGQADASLDPEREAAALVAFLDGLTLHAVTDKEGMPPDAAVAALDAYLGRIFDVRDERRVTEGRADGEAGRGR